MVGNIYGTSTRSIRVFNLSIHLIWLVLLILHSGSGTFNIDLPDTFEPRITNLMLLTLATVVLTLLSFITVKRKRIMFKFLSLLLGAMVQCIIAIKYASNYPPFDVMTVVGTLIALWFIGGAFYVKTTDCLEVSNATRPK